jgi:hypothetical protein
MWQNTSSLMNLNLSELKAVHLLRQGESVKAQPGPAPGKPETGPGLMQIH